MKTLPGTDPERANEKLLKCENWYKYKNKPENEQPLAALLLDATPNSEIKHIFESLVAKSNIRLNIMERPGPKNQFSLLATNNNEKPKCENENCLICKTKGDSL